MTGTYSEVGHEEHCPDINGPGCAANPVDHQWHALKLFFSDVRFNAEYGLLDWLSVDLYWSIVRIVDIQFQLQDAATRNPIMPPYGEELHHRTETIVGTGDPWLSLRATKRLAEWVFNFRAGFTVPIGATVENPFRLGREGVAHQHIQFGTGTVDPFIDVQASRAIGRFRVAGWTLGKLPLYENGHGYRAGPLLLAGLRASSDLWARNWSFALGAFVYHEQPERWDGLVETEGNLGRTDVLLDTTISVHLPRAVQLFLSARAPVYSYTVGAQLSTPAIVEIGVSRSFDLRTRR